MLLHQVALVSEVKSISLQHVSRTSAALQKQVMRDFAFVWNVFATVDAFAELEDVPVGYWPVIIRNDIGFAGAAGIHLDQDGQPFALVQASNTWPLTASHEVLEMLADPFGNRLIAGNSIKPDQGRVEYLVEVCDPSEAIQFGYTVNGITLSDFYTPRFFDPISAAGVQYSLTGAIKAPRTVLKDGYLSWHDPVTNHWWQQRFFGSQKTFRDLGVFSLSTESLRSEIDRRTFRKKSVRGLPTKSAMLKKSTTYFKTVSKSTASKAKSWRARIEAIKKQASSA